MNITPSIATWDGCCLSCREVLFQLTNSCLKALYYLIFFSISGRLTGSRNRNTSRCLNKRCMSLEEVATKKVEIKSCAQLSLFVRGQKLTTKELPRVSFLVCREQGRKFSGKRFLVNFIGEFLGTQYPFSRLVGLLLL